MSHRIPVTIVTGYLGAGNRVSAWLSDLVAAQGQDILRLKGIFAVGGDDRRLVVQAVHMVLEGASQREWQAGEARTSRIVFIGRHLDPLALDHGFHACEQQFAAAAPSPPAEAAIP